MLKLAAQQGLIFFFFIAFLISGCELFGNKQKKEEDIERSYTKSIERNYSNEFERALIDSAEAVYPPRDSVLAMAPSQFKDRIPMESYWYWVSFDGVLVAYAITHDAISYYSDLIDLLRAGTSHQFIKTADFGYEANISFKNRYEFDESLYTGENVSPFLFEEVYVVEMSILWVHQCLQQNGCGMYANYKRIVVFNKEGKIRQIFLDGVLVPSVN